MVARHVGGVHGPGGADAESVGNHLVLAVSGLPFVGMSWTIAEAEMAEFTAKHAWLSTAPDSPFLQVAMAGHRDAKGGDVIRGLVLTRIGEGAASSEPLTERTDWFGCSPTCSTFASTAAHRKRSTVCGTGSSQRIRSGTRPVDRDRR